MIGARPSLADHAEHVRLGRRARCQTCAHDHDEFSGRHRGSHGRRGQGPVILILHPGSDDGRSWGKVAALLARRFRVVRLHRRQYRLDIAGAPVTIGQEVDDVLAVVKVTGNPVVLVGHSSGGVVALEALVASRSSFAGAVLYEPPVVIGPPLGGEALARAKAALVAGRPGKAIEIFSRDIVGVSPLWSWLGGRWWPSSRGGAGWYRASSTTPGRSISLVFDSMRRRDRRADRAFGGRPEPARARRAARCP